MIHIFCGTDTLTSRKEFRSFIDSESAKGSAILNVEATQIAEHISGKSHLNTLFALSCLYVTENLNKYLGRKSTKKTKNKIYDHFLAISDSQDEVWAIWESESARNLKLSDFSKVHESKIPSTIFTLQSQLNPGNKLGFLKTLQALRDTLEEYFIFLMLMRHVRNLVLAASSGLDASISPWQKTTLIRQSALWDKTKLESLYDTFSKIDHKFKTGKTPFSLIQSIEIMSCYYL